MEKWAAKLTVKGVRKHLGYFTYEKDAVKARDDEVIKNGSNNRLNDTVNKSPAV
jgi:hypothetical protein